MTLEHGDDAGYVLSQRESLNFRLKPSERGRIHLVKDFDRTVGRPSPGGAPDDTVTAAADFFDKSPVPQYLARLQGRPATASMRHFQSPGVPLRPLALGRGISPLQERNKARLISECRR